ncbi:MAG: site-specific DNA-methyltransferase, partial [Pseudomonadales bacterium]|nr:site-specific DNA-methyltransferase [Pseudomonadales bacterium]
MAKKPHPPKTVATLKHDDATRKNIPTAEYQSVMAKNEQSPVHVVYERPLVGLSDEKSNRKRDLDPQLVWRGKDEQDWSDLVVHAPPLYIQEKVHPKVLIDDLRRRTEAGAKLQSGAMDDLFADFNGLPDSNAKTEFYQHDAHWANRMILGDSLQVMASLAEREGLRGKVQCIYFDPPYGIKFNSNFQWSTTSRDVKDGNSGHITREPEQVKAFRDTWRDGIHSYLTYLRDRLMVARDLLTESGSIFVQIGDENVHRVRAVMDEVFGEDNFVQTIVIKKKSSSVITEPVNDFVIWSCKKREALKIRELTQKKDPFSEKSRFSKLQLPNLVRLSISDVSEEQIADPLNRLLNDDYPMVSQDPQEGRIGPYQINAEDKFPGKNRHWTLDPNFGMRRIERANRLRATTNTVRGVIYLDDFGQEPLNNIWEFHGERDPIYVVQTNKGIAQRCVLMTTDTGDLVLDPTCGSGTTAAVAEHWGRRWITIDTSRVALALTRARIMGARFPFYLLADSCDGQIKEAEITHAAPSSKTTYGNVRQGFVYERVPHITLKSIATNTEIDVIWEKYQSNLEPLREQLNRALKQDWQEWEIPRDADAKWPEAALKLHANWWQQRIARQKEIDASIAAKADNEYLYDKPYEDKKKVRVAGPFTVESLSPHRVLGVDENDELIDGTNENHPGYKERDFVQIILENLKVAGVQQAHKEDKINFTALVPWPGDLICAEASYFEGGEEKGTAKRAAIFIGPEFGTVSRPDLVSAAREAGDADFDVLIACAFNYDAHSSEFDKLGRIPILKARMNADLHMADDLKTTSKGNLFVIFGEPDIDIINADNNQIQVKVNGVDVFHPNTGEVRSDGADGIACWFIDTDYNEESFFVRHAYFLGA